MEFMFLESGRSLVAFTLFFFLFPCYFPKKRLGTTIGQVKKGLCATYREMYRK